MDPIRPSETPGGRGVGLETIQSSRVSARLAPGAVTPGGAEGQPSEQHPHVAAGIRCSVPLLCSMHQHPGEENAKSGPGDDHWDERP